MSNTNSQLATGLHIVGSVPFASGEEVFRTLSRTLGNRLRRLPDGETGGRSQWIMWQWDVLKTSPGLQPCSDRDSAYGVRPQVELIPGGDEGSVRINPLGYAKAAISSYEIFASLKREGVIPGHLRFQVSLPSPLAPILAFVKEADRHLVEPAYEKAMMDEVARIMAVIPHDELAIQWDIAREFAILEGITQPHFEDHWTEIIKRLQRLADPITDDVELGYHLCYGDFGHRHFAQPKDAGFLAGMANRICESIARPITWFHFPVPIDRDDLGFFEPMRNLQIPPETELYAGLIHHSDGLVGARRRMAAARQFLKGFGVGTECGWGRRAPETLPSLLNIHAEIASPVV